MQVCLDPRDCRYTRARTASSTKKAGEEEKKDFFAIARCVRAVCGLCGVCGVCIFLCC